MATVDGGPAAYRRTYSPSRLAWSEGRQLIGAGLHCFHGRLTIHILVIDVGVP